LIAKKAYLCHLGKMAYADAWAWQKEVRRLRRMGWVSDTLLLVEHPPTYTCGRATRKEHRPLPEVLERRGAVLFEIERGGSATYHGPGQLVCYPIVDLRERGRDVHRYLRDLENVLIRTLACFGLEGRARPGLTGVWAGDCKVAAIGVHVQHWITLHGFALTVCPDLEYFRAIRPCGLESEVVASMQGLLGRPVELGEVEGALISSFQEVFTCRLMEVGLEELGRLASRNIVGPEARL
jgi:lipoate-protein ligase B